MLPNPKSPEEFDLIDKRSLLFIEAAKNIFLKCGKTAISTGYPSNGSLPVVFVNDQYAVKFFPKIFNDGYAAEVKALQFLVERNGLSPHLIEVGEVETWNYVVMNKLSGQSLKDLWPSLSEPDQVRACRRVGQALRELHSLKLPDKEHDNSSWSKFLSEQKKGCFDRHAKLGLQENLLKQIPEFLESVELQSNQLSFLHTEVMRDHVLFETSKDSLSFSGFIDFEPSMIGAAEYDFASVGVFLSCGERPMLHSFFAGYGNLELASDKNFRRRIMAYTLLHRYSNLKWYLQFMPNADSLNELADLWWGV